MCIRGDYLKTTEKKTYKAFRFFRYSWSAGYPALASVFYGGAWRKKTMRTRGISQHTNGNIGLHSCATLAQAKRQGGQGGSNRVYAEVRAGGKVAVFGRGKRITGYLSTRMEIVRIFAPRGASSEDVRAWRERYKVPVITL